MRVLNDYVAVKKLEKEKQTASGLIIPDTALSAGEVCEVVGVGPGNHTLAAERVPIECKAGDVVVLEKLPRPIEIDGEKIFFVREQDLLAIL